MLHLGGEPIHPLAATYGILLATVLGAMGLPHILVRFYTNRDGQAARRTTAFVLLLLGCFYIFPAVFAVLGRLEAPGLYVSGQTDSVVLVLPKLASAGVVGTALGALVAAGAFAAFLSTSSGLFISMAGAISHDIMDRGVRTFRVAALVIGIVMTTLGVFVAGISINVLVGWAFAIAASTFCPLLLLGIWWRRLTWIGALGGLILGGGASSLAVILTMVGVGKTGLAGRAPGRAGHLDRPALLHHHGGRCHWPRPERCRTTWCKSCWPCTCRSGCGPPRRAAPNWVPSCRRSSPLASHRPRWRARPVRGRDPEI